MPRTDVSLHGYPAVLVSLGVVVVLAALIAAVLRVLDTRLPFGSLVVTEAEVPEVPHPRAGAETVVERGSGAGR